jgi:hypothetical protein
MPGSSKMTELTLKWKEIFNEISLSDEHIVGKINYYNLASILEDLYVENVELKARLKSLENALMENKRVKIFDWNETGDGV